MRLNGFGDLARNLTTQNRSIQLRDTINRLTDELSSGRVADPAARLGGDLRRLADIDHSLRKMEGFRVVISEAANFTAAAQANLENVHGIAVALGETLIGLGQSTASQTIDRIRNQSEESLSEVLTRLNGAVGGRSLFAGVDTDVAPMVEADVVLDGLRAAVAGVATAQDLVAAADAWFSDPAGFRAAAYRGADQDLAPVRVGTGQDISHAVRADDPALRAVIRDIAVTVLATDGSVALDPGEDHVLFTITGSRQFQNSEAVVGLQADIGYAQEKLEEAGTRQAAERTSLQMLRSELLAADPFETAVRLEAAQFQLESLYTVTVRTSQLSLVGFLR